MSVSLCTLAQNDLMAAGQLLIFLSNVTGGALQSIHLDVCLQILTLIGSICFVFCLIQLDFSCLCLLSLCRFVIPSLFK